KSGLVSRPLAEGDATRIAAFSSALQGGGNWRSASQSLGHLLLDGVPLPENISQLLIVPDGVLLQAPFDTLTMSQPGPLLGAPFAISYLPSAALLLRPSVRETRMPWQRRLLGLGDPVVKTSALFTGDEHWSPLPESGRELRSIDRALPGVADIHTVADDRKT